MCLTKSIDVHSVPYGGKKPMRLFTKLAMGCLFLAVLLVGVGATKSTASSILTARATIAGAAGSGISGEVVFVQFGGGFINDVTVIARVSGLAPNTTHGFHLHEIGACAPTFAAAGGHFDPGPNSNSNPDTNHPFHMGDLPNLVADSSGVARLVFVTSRVTLTPPAPAPADPGVSLFDANGSAVIVHGNPDQGITGAAGSGVSGGPRIACGVIEAVD